APRGDPRGRGGPRRLAGGPARADPPGRRGPLPGPADPRLTRDAPEGRSIVDRPLGVGGDRSDQWLAIAPSTLRRPARRAGPRAAATPASTARPTMAIICPVGR